MERINSFKNGMHSFKAERVSPLSIEMFEFGNVTEAPKHTHFQINTIYSLMNSILHAEKRLNRY